LSPGDAAMDEDLDELANLEEFQLGTAPDDEDSDDDTLTDGAEVNTHNSNPLAVDTDTDALDDGVEVNTTGTLPDNPDTDGDGINDGPEVDAGTDPLLADATKPGVLHRYSFNASPGAAPAMTLVPDLVGGEDGTVIGANGVWTGASLRLPGGDGATADAAYVDLPNGLLSSHDHVTFEAWYTMRSAQNWSRIWDFGSTLGGEVITGMTGATEGQDYFIFAPNRGAEINQQRYTVRNLDPLAPGGGVGPVDGDEEAFDTNEISAIDQEYHIAGVWTSDGAGGAQLILYRDGALLGSRTTSFGPRDINDVNNWLGRSNWTGDSYLDGELNEFRIYDGALNQAAAASSFNAGADASIGGGDFRITQIIYDPGSDMISLTFTSRNNRTYSLYWDSDLNGLDQELDDSILSDGETTSVGPFPNPSPGAPRVFFRVVEN
ncbi:MAG: LamG-like jellyroll fold domain-containing protein, partial [Verrucomicrobiales bacterium]